MKAGMPPKEEASVDMRDEPDIEKGQNSVGEVLRQEIELRAYFKYCKRGCVAGCDVDDWLAAEQEILAEGAAVPHAGATETPETPLDATLSQVVSADSPGGKRRERGSNRLSRT